MYYLVNVKFEVPTEKEGKTKTIKELYVVSADSVSAAEKKALDATGEGTSERVVESVRESKILGVLR